MNLETLFSILLYLLTFSIGLLLEYKQVDNRHVSVKLYTIWLYVFLCFGYMTGSDWRAYEVRYYAIESYEPLTDFLFYYIQLFFSGFIKDYWVFCGVAKCIYLYSTIKLIKEVTPYWKSTVAFLIPGTLVFMLIQNPLRFMFACILINYAVSFWLKKKYIEALLVFIPTLFIHASCIAYIVLIPALSIVKYINKINDIVLLVLFIGVLYITSNQAIIQSMFESAIGQAMTFSDGLDKFTDFYSVENVDTFFTIGSLLQIVFFGIILVSKRFFFKSGPNGVYLYGGAIYYLFLAKLFLVIPNGFRLAIPFSFFFACCLSMFLMNHSKKILSSFFILYFSLSFTLSLWTNFDLIPYSNSIPYITFGHKPYNERNNYNLKCYKERTGKTTFDSLNFDVE